MNTPASTRVLRMDYARQQMSAGLERVLYRVAGTLAPTRHGSTVDSGAMLSVLVDSIGQPSATLRRMPGPRKHPASCQRCGTNCYAGARGNNGSITTCCP